MALPNLAEVHLTTNELSESGRQQLATVFPQAKIAIGEHRPDQTESFVRDMSMVFAHLKQVQDWHAISPDSNLVELFPDKGQRGDAINKLKAHFNGQFTVSELDAFSDDVLARQGITIKEMVEVLARQRRR